MAVAAPVIVAEMADWTALGGGNSGIVGDGAHGSGFHRAANEVPASDYSRRRDPNGADGPYVDWRYACAGDFRHGGDPNLRAKHREVLARLMAGDPKLSMICEFIGQPWPDKPVYYWARWNGVGTLARYTGRGHDLWTHIAWYRSRADQRAYLWTPEGEDEDMGRHCKLGDEGENVKDVQFRLNRLDIKAKKPGGKVAEALVVDGKYQAHTAAAVEVFERSRVAGYSGRGERVTAATWTRLDDAYFLPRKDAPRPQPAQAVDYTQLAARVDVAQVAARVDHPTISGMLVRDPDLLQRLVTELVRELTAQPSKS